MNSILLFLGGVGAQEILVIGLMVLVLFGAKKIPEFMKGIGKGVREFQDGVKGAKDDFEKSVSAPREEAAPVVSSQPAVDAVK